MFFSSETECMRSGHFLQKLLKLPERPREQILRVHRVILSGSNVESRTEGYPFQFFWHCAIFLNIFCLQSVPLSILLESPLVIS